MNTGQVKIAIGIHTDIIAGILRQLYAQGTIPQSRDIGNLHILMNEPRLEIANPATNPQLILRIQGSFSSTDTPATPFTLGMELLPFVRTVSGQAPVAALEAGNITDASPASIGPLIGSVATGEMNSILQNMDIPIFNSLISGLETSFFEPDALPPRSSWATSFSLGRASGIEHIKVGFPPGQPQRPNIAESTTLPTDAALMATISLPGESPQLPGNISIVPHNTGIQILIPRNTMDAVLSANAKAQVNTVINGALIKSVSMKMHDLGIEIKGKAEKSVATINWNGVLLLYYSKYYYRKDSIRWHDGFVNIFTSGINVDVDLPWYVHLLRAFLFVLGPVGWILDATLVAPKLKEADEAPNIVRGAFRSQVANALTAMTDRIGNISPGNRMAFMDFGQDAWILEGHYMYSISAFAGLNRDTLSGVEYDRFDIEGAHGKSVGMLNLGSGKRMHPEELGRLLKAGIMKIAGLHGVQAPFGFYVRSNPNRSTADNLVDPADIIKE